MTYNNKSNCLLEPLEVRPPEPTVGQLAEVVAAGFVRRDSKFFDVNNPSASLSKDDVHRACLHRFRAAFPGDDLPSDLIRDAFHRAIEQKHTTLTESIPVWDGHIICRPGEPRFIWKDGIVSLNSWQCPEYRTFDTVQASYGEAQEFLDWIFPSDAERDMFLDWLAWCLQHEDDKPSWAPFLYSASKGSGKSSLCKLVACLFGERNAVTQNNVEKLTGRFNATVLTSKLVICEEIHLSPGSSQGNALKTYLTETETLAERKHQEAVRLRQVCCFLATSNHLPLWIEGEDRRFWITEINHDGHASGPRAKEFSELVGRMHAFMERPAALARLYRVLMERELSPNFSAKTLNVVEHATPVMRRVFAASEATVLGLLREHLQSNGTHAVPEGEVARVVLEDLRANVASTKHLMTELGWQKMKVKWGGKDYARSVWIEPGYWAEKGKLRGPNGYEMALAQHFGDPSADPDFGDGASVFVDSTIPDGEVY